MFSFYLYVRKLFCALVQKYLPNFWITIFLSILINLFVLFSGIYFCGEEAWQFEVYFFQIIFNIFKKKTKTLSRCLKIPEVKYSFWPCLKSRYLFINSSCFSGQSVVSFSLAPGPEFVWASHLTQHSCRCHDSHDCLITIF